MSLHALAGHMATKGRGGDSMLVHMTPQEVQSLQAMALKGGGSLTINPDTGLPEANFLKKLLPAIAGAALNFFAPGVGTAIGGAFGLGGAAGAGIAIGGITTLATGSLSRGLMAGLGAYGGAGLAGGLANAGTGALSAEAGNAALTNAGLTGEAALTSAADDVAQRAIGERLASATPFETLKAGASAVTDSSAALGNFAKNNITSGLAAISPMLADKGVQTTTKMPSTGTIRRYNFDPYGQTYTPAGEYAASEEDRKATGGIVALAGGGVSDQEVKDWLAANDMATDAQIAEAMQQHGVNPDQVARVTGIGMPEVQERYDAVVSPPPAAAASTAPQYTNYTAQDVTDYLQANPNADIAAATQQFNADPTVVNKAIGQLGAGFLDPTQTAKGSGSGQYFDTFSKYGIDANELFAANKALNPNYSFAGDTTAGEMNRAFEMARDFKGFNPGGISQALQDVEWVKKMDTEGANAVDIARLTGLSIGEVQAREAAARTLMTKGIGTGKLDTVDILPGGGPGGISGGGNTVVNPNGTVTTTPNIPGRPDGGFTGMGQVRDAYTAGGGSLGYTNNAPIDMPEFNRRFNRLTGDSLDAYNYLMGKGKDGLAPRYPTQSGVGQIMRPYGEGALGFPVEEGRPTQQYIYDPITRRYKKNINYIPVTYDSKGNKVYGASDAQLLAELDKVKTSAASGGIMALADGGTAQESVDSAMQSLNTFMAKHNVSYERIASLLNISVAEAKRRYPTLATGTGTGTAPKYDANSAGSPEGTAPGPSGFAPDANSVTNGAFAAAMDALGLSQDPGPVGVVSMGETGFAPTAAEGEAAADGVGMSGMGMGSVGAGEGAGAAGGGNAAGGDGNSGDGGTGDSGTAVKRGGRIIQRYAVGGGLGGLGALARGGAIPQYNLGGYSDGGRLLRGPGDGVSDSIPATIGNKQPARLADGEFVVPARIVSELGNGSTEAGARKLYAMMDRVQKARGKTTGKSRVAANTRSDKYLPA